MYLWKHIKTGHLVLTVSAHSALDAYEQGYILVAKG